MRFTLARFTSFLIVLVLGILFVILLSMPSFPAQALQCIYYVSTDGSDSNNGSLSNPFGTLQKGVDALGPGEVLCVREGTYHQTVHVRTSGTSSKPITVMAYPGEQAIIDGRGGVDCLNCGLPLGPIANTDPVSGKGFNWNPLVGIEGDFVHFEGFTITRSMGRCVRIWRDGGHVTGTVFRNNRIHDCRDGGIVFVNSPDHTLIENNEISLAGSFATYSRGAGTLDWSAGIAAIFATNTTIRGNVVHENWGEGVIIGRDSAHTVFQDNILYDNYALQLYLHATDDALVQRNLLYHSENPEFYRGGKPSACIVIASAEPQWISGDVTGVQVINNIAVGCHTNLAFWDGRGTLKNILIAFNTLANAYAPTNASVGLRVGFSNSAKFSNVEITNNLIVQNTGTLIAMYDQSGVTYTNNLWSSATIPAGAGSTGDMIGNPQLVNPDAGLGRGIVSSDWYRLTGSSPAINSGLHLSEVTEDFYRVKRDFQPDMGAHEFSGVQTPTFTDVPFDHPYHDEIEILYQGGYISGCSQNPLIFCPDDKMTRAESAVFVERGIWSAGHLPQIPTVQLFEDLELSNWAAKWATALYNDGYTAGCEREPLQYCPWDEHTRTEGAVFFLRMHHGTAYGPPPAVGIFADVPTEFWGAKWIEAAYEAGIVNACADDPMRFCPEDPLTRGLAAWMMVQAK